MAPPGPLNLDVEAISGICGSISIACWVVVFSPQIVENFRRSSADGLSLQFLIVWLAGDVFNILGAVLQGVLPTMLILAVYYTLADIVLLGQCFYYRGFTWRDEVVPPAAKRKEARASRATARDRIHGDGALPDEHTRLLVAAASDYESRERRGSDWSANLTHLSPAVPIVPGVGDVDAPLPRRHVSRLKGAVFNTFAMLIVVAAGVCGWWLSRGYTQSEGSKRSDSDKAGDLLEMNMWGQIFGWLCAALYLGSRLPQLLLNWRRQSTEGVSMLFFLFACLGNLTYVLSIVAYEPRCAGTEKKHPSGGREEQCPDGEAARMYWQYILVNLSWLAGSLGTLFLDVAIFVQFFIYRTEDGDGNALDTEALDMSDDEDSGVDELDEATDDEGSHLDRNERHRYDPRPLLERNTSTYS